MAKTSETMRREVKQWWTIRNKGKTMTDWDVACYNAMAVELVSQAIDTLSANNRNIPIDSASVIKALYDDFNAAKERHKANIKETPIVSYDISEDGIKEITSFD